MFLLSCTYWLEGPGDLLGNQGKKNTRFHLNPLRFKSYDVKNTYREESAAEQKFEYKILFLLQYWSIHLAFSLPCVESNSANETGLRQHMHFCEVQQVQSWLPLTAYHSKLLYESINRKEHVLWFHWNVNKLAQGNYQEYISPHLRLA